MNIERLSVSFGEGAALRSFSFSCEPGNVVGIVGPNGSGKSTVVNVLTNMLRTADFAPVRALSTRTFQDARLWDGLSVLECVLTACESRSVWGSLVQWRNSNPIAYESLRRVGLWHKRDGSVVHLSYGERKLVELARALASRQPVLFLDELFAGLSTHAKKTVRSILAEEKAAGKQIVLIEHDMKLTQEMCDRVYVLDAGECIAQGEPSEVFATARVQQTYSGISYE